MKKGIALVFVLLIILAIFAIAGASGYLVWKNYQSNNQEETKTTPDSTTKTDETASWQAYNNVDFGYTIKYPKNWYFYSKGFNPPPPAGIFLANQPEGTAPMEYSSFTINVDSEVNTTLDEYGEVTSLVSQGNTKTDATVSGQSAVKLKSVDVIGKTDVSYYVLYKNKMYRLGYQFPKTQADQEAVCEKILKTFKLAGTATASDMSAGNIQVGSATIGDLSTLQASVDKGEQTSYLDPVKVAQLEGVKYGFSANDTFVLTSKEYAEMAGTYLATVNVTHNGTIYIIQLIQPETQGEKGIWAINNIGQE